MNAVRIQLGAQRFAPAQVAGVVSRQPGLSGPAAVVSAPEPHQPVKTEKRKLKDEEDDDGQA